MSWAPIRFRRVGDAGGGGAGAVGPAGPAGPAGATGPAGPAGPSGGVAASTLAALYQLGAAPADATLVLDATRGGLVLNSATALVPLTIRVGAPGVGRVTALELTHAGNGLTTDNVALDFYPGGYSIPGAPARILAKQTSGGATDLEFWSRHYYLNGTWEPHRYLRLGGDARESTFYTGVRITQPAGGGSAWLAVSADTPAVNLAAAGDAGIQLSCGYGSNAHSVTNWIAIDGTRGGGVKAGDSGYMYSRWVSNGWQGPKLWWAVDTGTLGFSYDFQPRVFRIGGALDLENWDNTGYLTITPSWGGHSRLYYDNVLKKVRLSIDGGAYSDLVTTATLPPAPAAPTLSAAYAGGASSADSTLTLDATRGGVTIAGGTVAAPFKVTTAVVGGGIEIKRTDDTKRTGLVLTNNAGAILGGVAIATAYHEWVYGSGPGDLVLFAPPTTGRNIFISTAYNSAAGYIALQLSNGVSRLVLNNDLMSAISMANITSRGLIAPTTGAYYNTAQATTFAPASGTASFRALDIAYTVNQTGGASGPVTGIYLNATETAVIGTHDLINLLVGGSSRFKVWGNSNNYIDLGSSFGNFGYIGSGGGRMVTGPSGIELLPGSTGNVLAGKLGMVETDTSGFLFITSTPTAPTGIPSGSLTSRAPIHVDVDNRRLWVYCAGVGGGWKYAALA